MTLRVFPSNSFSSMNRRFLLYFILSATSARLYPSVCEKYRLAFTADVTGPSVCNNAGYCEYLSVTCKAAFGKLMNLQKRLIDVPPILLRIGDDEVQAMRLNGDLYRLGKSPLLPRGIAADLAAFQEAANIVLDRIFGSYPHMVFDMQIDGHILTELVANATHLGTRISEWPNRERDIRFVIYKSKAFQKFTYAIRVMFDHLAVPGKTTEEIGASCVAFAPFVHAYMHVTHLLKVHVHQLFESRTSEDIIATMVRYHPLYTLDDGVWYIRMSRAWFDWHQELPYTPIPLDSNDLEHALSMMKSVSGITVVPSAHFDDDSTAPLTAVVNWESFPSTRTQTQHDSFRISYYVFRIMRENYGESFCYSNNFPNDTLPFIMAIPLSYASVALADMASELVPAHLLLNQIVPMSKTRVPILGQYNRVRIPIRQSNVTQDILHGISMLSMFGLSFITEFQFDDGKIVPAYDLIRHVLEDVYENGPPPNGQRRYKIALGRLFALAIQSRKGLDVLARLIRSQEGLVEAPTIHETIFFSSHYIRSGFYDIYHEGTLESLFRNNGTRLIEALVVASME